MLGSMPHIFVAKIVEGGVALGWLSLVRPLIARKLLAQASGAEIEAPQSFYVTWPARHKPRREAAQTGVRAELARDSTWNVGRTTRKTPDRGKAKAAATRPAAWLDVARLEVERGDREGALVACVDVKPDGLAATTSPPSSR